MLTPDFFSTLDDLTASQSRDWFRTHRERIRTDCEAPVLAVIEEVAERLEAASDGLHLGDARLFRLARDVRFSKDKRPYKEHVAGTLPLSPGGTGTGTVQPAALYLQVGLSEMMAGAGVYTFGPEMLERYRERVLDPATGEELAERTAALKERGYSLVASGQLKRAPKGVDPAHPRIDLLRMKGLAVTFPGWPEGLELSHGFAGWLTEQALSTLPVVRWLADCE